MFKITHKIALLIIVPLAIELCFLGVVISTLDEVETNRALESQAVEYMVYVNLILHDAWSVSNQMVVFRTTQAEKDLEKLSVQRSSLEAKRNKLIQISNRSKTPKAKEVRDFLQIVEKVINLSKSSSDIIDESLDFHQINRVRKLTRLVEKLNETGMLTIEKQSELRAVIHEKQTQARIKLKAIVQSAALANVVLAVILAVFFSLTFASRLKVLMNNTMNIAIGKPLEKPLEGADELAKLDKVIHGLSSELEHKSEKERAMIDNTAVIICSLDESFKISEVNPAIKTKLGYKPDELIGLNLINLIHAEDQDECFEKLNSAKNSTDEITFEARFKKESGSFLHTDWSANFAKKSKSIFCVIHDISERKEAERLKKEVIAMVVHDLRAPITSIGVILDMMREGVVGDLNERGERMVSLAQQSVGSLVTMINDLLEVEQIESGNLVLNYEISDSESIVKNAISMVKPEAEKKSIKFSLLLTKNLMEVDQARVSRVLVNIIGNAIKFSPEESTIEISSKLNKEDTNPSFIEFRINDQGPGIPQSKITSIFEKFKQAGSGSEGEAKGSGLGLAICKAIVEAHHGEIGVESKPEEGSTFWFNVPKSPFKPGEDKE